MGTQIRRAATVVCILAIFLAAPWGPADAQVGDFTDVLYVPNFVDGTISVVDVGSNTVIDTLSLASVSGPMSLAASPDGTKLFVVQAFSNSVAIIDSATGAIEVELPTGDLPMRAALNEDGSRLYVTNFFAESVTVIDTQAQSVVDTIDLDNGISFPSFPVGLTFSPDYRELWVASQFPGRVDIVDPATNQLVDSIPINVTAPVDIDFSADGSLVYVAGHQTESLVIPDATCIIDTGSRAVLGEVLGDSDPNIGPGVAAVAIAGNGSAYISNSGRVDDNFQPLPPFTDSITKVDLAGNTSRIPSGGLTPAGISVSPDGRFVYVSNALSNTLGIIDTNTDTLVATVAVGTYPAFSHSSRRPTAPPIVGAVEAVASVQTRKLLVDKKKRKISFDFRFDLGGGSGGIDPLTEAVFMQFDGLWINIPGGLFERAKKNQWKYRGRIDGVDANVTLKLEKNGMWSLKGNFKKAAVETITNDVSVTFRIGDDGHSEEMTANIVQ